jgi:hypothetical protein
MMYLLSGLGSSSIGGTRGGVNHSRPRGVSSSKEITGSGTPPLSARPDRLASGAGP